MVKPYITLIASKLIGVCGGLVTTELVARKLSASQQGIFYSYLAVLAAYYILDSFAQLLLVRVSHFHEKITVDETKKVAKVSEEFAGLMRGVMKWAVSHAVIGFIVAFVCGHSFFRESQDHNLLAWTLTCAAASGLSMMTIVVSVIEGLGRIQFVASLRCWQALAWHVATIFCLLRGGALFSIAAGFGAMVIVLSGFLFRWRFLFKCVWEENHDYPWRYLIWPAQWRTYWIGLSTWAISGLPVLALCHFQGDVIAGKFGMTRRLLEILLFAGSAVFTTQTVRLGALYSEGKITELWSRWKSASVTAVGIVCMGSILFWWFATTKLFSELELTSRTSNGLVLFFLLLANVGALMNWAISICIRSSGHEPFARQNMVLLILGAPLLIMSAKYFSDLGMAACLLSLTVAVILPWNILMVHRFIKKFSCASMILTPNS